MRIAMIGATGLVGRALVARLSGHRLTVLSRRPSGLCGDERIGEAPDWPRLLAGDRFDAAISTLGTTWRKAGSWAAFEKVDHDAVIDFAKAARRAGARQFLSVSAIGADASSSNEYLAIKGRTDRDLAALGFARLDIFRPGLLRGPRGDDRRLGERVGIAVSPLVNLFLRGRFADFAAIDASTVAIAMAAVIGDPADGRFVHRNREIRRLAAGRDGPQPLR